MGLGGRGVGGIITDQDRKKLDAEIEAFLDTHFIREKIPPLAPEGIAELEKGGQGERTAFYE